MHLWPGFVAKVIFEYSMEHKVLLKFMNQSSKKIPLCQVSESYSHCLSLPQCANLCCS